jgi:hypothetical protein
VDSRRLEQRATDQRFARASHRPGVHLDDGRPGAGRCLRRDVRVLGLTHDFSSLVASHCATFEGGDALAGAVPPKGKTLREDFNLTFERA